MPRDEAEFRAFVEARWTSLVRYAYALTGDLGHAEDVVQTVLEQSWRRWSDIRDDSPEGYVRTALVRQVISRHRWVRRRPPERLDDQQSTTRAHPVTQDGSDDRAVRALLWAELTSLPPRMRAIVVLRLWEDLPEQEVAALLGCSVGSVKSQLSRGVRRLRERSRLRGLVGLAPALNPTPTSTGRTS